MTKLNNDPSKSNLIVVKSELNDKNSTSYLNRIKSIHDEYSDEVNLIEIKVTSQKDFEKALKEYRGSVLCLYPHNLRFPNKHENRNIELDQIIQVVKNIVYNINKPQKIMIIGNGEVGKKLTTVLDDTDRVVFPVAYRKLDMINDDLLNEFDIIVNCTRCDNKVNLFYDKLVIDVSGSFKAEIKEYTNENNSILTTYTPQPTILTRGDIGKSVVHTLLQDVINKGI